MENDFEKMRGKRSWRSALEPIAALIVVSVVAFNLTRGDGWELDVKIGNQLIEWGYVERGERVLSNAIDRAEMQGAASLPLVEALGDLASSHVMSDRPSDAEPLLQRALTIQKEILGDTHPDIADSLHELASIYRSQNWHVAAEPLFSESLSIRESTLGPDHLLVSESLVELAMVEVNGKRYEEAEQNLQRAELIVQSQLGSIHPRQVGIANAFAALRRAQRRFMAADQYLIVALKIAKLSSDPAHSRWARSLDAIDAIEHPFGGFVLAEQTLDRVIQQVKRLTQTSHPQIASLYNNMGLVSLEMRRFGKAEADFMQALALEGVAETGDPLSVFVYCNLGTLYENQGRYAEARGALESARLAATDSLRPNHPLRLVIDQRLATMRPARS